MIPMSDDFILMLVISIIVLFGVFSFGAEDDDDDYL